MDLKTREKIYYNVDKAKLGLDPRLFKKLTDDIWEFRTKYNGLEYRLFAFWDRTGKSETLVISTHGIVKKVNKVPKSDIKKQKRLEKNILNSRIMGTKSKKMKMMTLDQLKDRDIGEIGTPERDKYEFDLRMELLGEMIKTVRKERKLTQEQLGKLIGVQKSQISKLERNTKNVTIETILKVFQALKANVKFSVEMNEAEFDVA
jgi:HTH-type transcriptional regulator/antitoxin HipB